MLMLFIIRIQLAYIIYNKYSTYFYKALITTQLIRHRYHLKSALYLL